MLAVGVFGIVSGADSNAMTNLNRNYNTSSRMNGWSNDSYGGMMGNQGNVFSNKDYSNTEKQSNEVLEEQVEKYISQFDEALEISDIFIFSDTDYYYSIIE